MTIKEARKAAGLTMAELSRQFEIPRRTLEDWESGKRTPAPWAEKLIIEKLTDMTTADTKNSKKVDQTSQVAQ